MDKKEFDIKYYLRLILQRRHLFIITSMIIMGIIIIFAYIKPKVYEASCTMLIERNVINKLIKGIAVTPSMEERINVLSYAMKNRSLLSKVIRKVNFDVDMNDPVKLEDLIERLQENTSIRVKKKDMFVVSYRDRDPKRARDFVNTLVNMYVEENLSAKRNEAYGANRFLKEQIQFFKDKIDRAEEKIIDFRKKHDILLATTERDVVAEIKALQEKLNDLMLKRETILAKRRQIKAQLSKEKPYTVAIFGSSNTQNLSNRLLQMQARLNELLLKYTQNYPEVVRLKAEIEALSQQLKKDKKDESTYPTPGKGTSEMSTINPLYQQLKEELAKTEYEMSSVYTQINHYKKLIQLKRNYLMKMPAERKKLADLERERDTYKEIYEKLVFRLGQSEVSKQMEVQDKSESFNIVEPAILPAKPVSPNRKLLILFAIFAGFSGGIALLIGLDYMDSSIRSVDAVKELGIPVLAVIPSIENPLEIRKRKRRDLLVFSLFGVYMLFVLGLFTIELLQLNYIDKFLGNIRFQEHIMEITQKIKGLFI